MSMRTTMLVAAALLLSTGLLLTLKDLFRPAPDLPRQSVALAAAVIEPYTILSLEMVRAGEPLPAAEARARGAWPVDAVLGKMSTQRITPGSLLTGVNLKPIEAVRFVDEMGLEVVSFAAGVDRLVGGQLRPGHLINLYGYGRDGQSGEAYTRLIEPRLWVVDVSTAGGQAVDLATPRPGLQGEGYAELREGRDRPGTMVTIAVEPERAYRVIDALGAQGLSAWVTLAASELAQVPPRATSEPVRAAPTLDVWATLQALSTSVFPTLSGTGYGGLADR
ncbi:MAG: hypothetical protein H6648_03220 [Caldilineae bacterium]|nr:hypothetical protein [Caldilineae bacterium]